MTRVLFALLLGLFFLCALHFLPGKPSASEQESERQPAAPSNSALPSLAAVKACLQPSPSPECLDALFREALKTHTTRDALALLRKLESEDSDVRRDCHPIVHSIGRETFLLKGNIHDSFSACDQTCHSGCYHGSVERFLRGDAVYSQADKHPSQAELKQKASTACDLNTPVRLRYQCLHGLGHALLFFSRYKLDQALTACDGLPDGWSQSSCYGGVFMENVFNAAPETRDLSPTDYHYPCNRLDAKYRNECYVMQTSRMSEMGLSTRRLFEECEKANEHSALCALSIGRDLSNEARAGRTRAAAEQCEIAPGLDRLACVRGVIYALIDNTWDGRDALPFCAALGQEADREICFRESIEYLKTTFEKSPAEITADCSRHLSRPDPCLKHLLAGSAS